MDEKIKLGVSACLLGEKVRYDGGHKLDAYLTETLGRFVDWVPVCPEVECGLPTPRESMHLSGDADSPRLVTVRSGADHTNRMTQWADKRLDALENEGLCGFIFKSRSPSSGMRGIKIYSPEGMPISAKGVGIWARAFMERFPLIPVEDEGRLHDPDLRENFIERVFVYRRWREFIAAGGCLNTLVEFHTDHKLILMAHSPKHYQMLGRLVAGGKKVPKPELRETYLITLMEGLKLIATIRKNTNVLQHMAGYFKNALNTEDKLELQETIGHYHKGLVPLIVPITLLRHYVRKFNEPYLSRQIYLNPHPMELKLRNHV